jgi:hypothetical protein
MSCYENISRIKDSAKTSLLPDEYVLTREIETWIGFIDKLPSDEDKVMLTKLLESCYKYSVVINSHAQTHPFPSESLIMALLEKLDITTSIKTYLHS